MNAKNVILTLAIAALFLIAAVGSASAKECGIGIADCDCGDTVVANWALTGNMFCPAGHGLIVGADNIVIDGAGYTIDGIDPGACGSRAGIYSDGYDDVTIRNLKVRKFCNGIFIENYAYRNTIHNCEVYDNGIDTVDAGTMGMRLIRVDDSTISNNSAHDTKGKGDGCESGGNGIYIFAGHRNLVTNNSLYDNRKSGYFTKMQPRDTNVTHNNIWGNGGCGINLMCMMSNYHIIEHNNVWENGCGIQTNGEPNTIRYNNVTNNAGRGIIMAGGTVNSNIVCGNGGTDISAQSAGSVTGDDNTCDTTSNYHDDGEDRCTWLCPDVPDMVITKKSEEWVVEGLTYNITYTIKNFGKVTANASKTGIYIDDELNTTDDVPELVVGASINHEVGPFTISEDSDTIEVCADCEDNVSESWENNNCKKNVFVSEPDLVIVEKTEEWVVEGSTYNITYTVKNIGTYKASASKTGIYIDDVLNTTDDVPELDPDASYSNTLGPFTLSEYVDTIKICADCEYNVSESFETNNCMTNVFGVADLIIAGKTEEWIAEGSTYNITYEVKNIGFARASASKTGICIDDIFNRTDDVPELDPDASYSNTLGPFTMSGYNDEIKVCADYEGNVLEINEDNNCTTNVFGVPIYVNTSGWWRVGGPFNPSSSPIQAAVNNAVAEDTIVVKDGTYTENVNVNTAHLTIQSENGSANCVVQASNHDDHVFYLGSSAVNIVGFRITGANNAYGIYSPASYCNIRDNNLLSNNAGVCIKGSYGSCVNNTVSNNYYGIRTILSWGGTQNAPKFINNTVTDNYYGFSIGGTGMTYDAELIDNTALNNTYGIYLCGHYTMRTKLMSNTALNNTYGIYLGGDYTTDTELISNTASNNTYGIYLGGSETYYTKLTNNIACENENTDIYVGDYATVSVSVDNTCSTTHNFNDEGEEGCTWKCLPDLTIVEKMEQWVVEGSTYNVAYTVENIGTSRANASKTCIYIDGILNATDDVPELEAGDNHTATLGPFSLSEGNDTIKVCADCEDNVTECDEENNCLENVFGLGCLAEDGTIFFCGDTVTKSCTFQGDMSCSFTDGLKIGADNITINGNDFILDGAGCMHDFPHSGILNEGYDDVTIESLEVKGFCHGMYLYGTGAEGDVYRNTIEHCDIHHNGNASTTAGLFGITMKYVYNSTIRNNTVHHQIAGVDPNPGCEDGGNGMFLYKGCYNNFTENKVYNNTKGGIFIKMQPMHNNISHNDLWDNGQGGIILRCMMSNYNLIEHNNASNNYGSGMFIGARNNTIRYNKICDNKDGGPYSADSVGGHGYGIKMGRSDGSFNNYLHDNEICGNDYKDIYMVSGVTGNHGINNTCDTTYNYGDDGTTGCTLFCGGTTIIAGFTAEPTKGAVPLTVNFTDKSKAKEGIESWSWNFDDGATSEAQNATHTYETTDAYSYYNVSLTVNESGSGGLSNDTDTKPEYIKVWKPKAAPNADFVCSKGVGATTEPVEFTDKSIGEVNAGSWLWDFGDGNTSTEQNPVYCYSKEGIYTVSLTVTGPGGTSKDTKSNCTRVGPGSGEQWPLIDAHFFASTRTGYAPFTVQFTDMSRSEGNITSWLWDFGDENMSDGRNPTHTYASPGTYNVSIETTSTTGAKTRETKTEYISVLSREYIPTTPFVINGRTFNAEGCGLNNCTVTIENLNTNANWTAKTSATSNYYQLVLDSDDVSAGDTLRFNAMKEAYSNTTYCTVTQEDINLGGVFSFNLTLAQGDITPPASVTDLTNVTYEQTYINWTWTDPAGADFSHVIVYVDGGFKQNVPKGVQHYNATGFEPDTEHTIATRTEDRSGNINLTWVNRTARTSSPPVEVVDDLTTEDIFVKGTVTNDHTYTHTSNDKYESIEEIRQGPRSLLEHKWTIEVPTGTKSSVTFHLEAHQIDTGENDHFIFAYSTDGSIYKDMVKVNTTTDTNLTYELTNELSNDFSGAVYIRVRDTDRNRGKKVLDTISIDHMFIRSVLAPLSYGVTVTIDEASQTVKPGESTTYHVRAKNTGDFDASYSVVMSGTAVDEATIDVSPPNWNTGTLGPNTENVQTVTVSTTSGTLDGTYTMIATATCEQDESVTDSATSKLVVSSVTNTMHIDSIDMSLSQRKAGKNIFTHATALITIVDATGAPADGATVGGHWSDVTTDTDSGLTNSTGQVSLNSEEVKNAPSGTTFTFTVDDVSLTGGTYDPESNVETSDSITV